MTLDVGGKGFFPGPDVGQALGEAMRGPDEEVARADGGVADFDGEEGCLLSLAEFVT